MKRPNPRRRVGLIGCAIVIAIVGLVLIPIVLRHGLPLGPKVYYSVAVLAGLTIYGLYSAFQPREKGRVEKAVSGALLAILILILAALVWLYLNPSAISKTL